MNTSSLSISFLLLILYSFKGFSHNPEELAQRNNLTPFDGESVVTKLPDSKWPKGSSKYFNKFGKSLIWILPKLIKFIGIIGTIAMLLVGGGIFVHNITKVHDFFHAIPSIISELIVGLIVGLIAFLIVYIIKKIIKR